MSRLLVLACALLAASPAAGGTRATYNGTSEPRELVVEIADNGGAARVSVPGRDDYGLMLGDQFYLVKPQDGKPQVARVADVAAALDRVMPPIFKNLFGAVGGAIKDTPLYAVRGGSKTVAGIAGEVWLVKGLDDEKPDAAAEVVVSHDPALAPVGRALAAFLESSMVMMRPLIGSGAAMMVRQNRQLFALGTPIASADRFTLTKVESVAEPASRFVLPARTATVDELVAEMKITPTN
ncbi:MAG: hypothetical protein J0I25_11015 [Sphingomonadales bacterium]|nr:hypothetical protein [Sphingomonadales bacterium]